MSWVGFKESKRVWADHKFQNQRSFFAAASFKERLLNGCLSAVEIKGTTRVARS